MTRLLITATAAVVSAVLSLVVPGCNSASAQVGMSAPSPLGMTSPLGIGPGAAVPRTGIPLGTTELGSVGVSPTTSGTSPLAPATSSSLATCTGINSPAGNLSGNLQNNAMSSPTASSTGALFDGGGLAGTPSGTCAGIAGTTTPASPSPFTPSAVGRIGIPMDSTELGVGGLSPLPATPTPNPSAPSMTPLTSCTVTGTSVLSGSC
jgi:hypothetical protein